MKTIVKSPLRAWREMKAEPIHDNGVPLPTDPAKREKAVTKLARKQVRKRK